MKLISKIVTAFAAPFVFAAGVLSGCFLNKPPAVTPPDPDGESGIMRDVNVAPTVTPVYSEAIEKVYSDYKKIADAHADADGDVDFENEEVAAAACKAAAEMFAYSRYNLYYLDKFVFFSEHEGSTDLGAVTGAAKAIKQEYFIRVNENPLSCGYRYHYTIKKVSECTGMLATIGAGLFESGRVRITDKTDLLYRFECNDMKAVTTNYNEVLGCEVMACPWVKGKDWAKPDLKILKREPIAVEDVKKDIEENAGYNDVSMPGNVNILADGILQAARIMEDTDGYILIMNIDTDVANGEEASLRMLRNANDSEDCVWHKGESNEDDTLLDEDTGLKIVCRMWKNGLMRQCTVSERWAGKISMFSGSADSVCYTYYSYSDRDCDMTEALNMIKAVEEAK